MSSENIIYERRGLIAYLTLNPPEKLNTLNDDLMAGFKEAMVMVEANGGVRSLILTGAGRACCSSFDILGSNDSEDSSSVASGAGHTLLQGLVNTFMTVWNCRKPVIAAVGGYALGGGCELIRVCDVKITSDKALIGETSIRA